MAKFWVRDGIITASLDQQAAKIDAASQRILNFRWPPSSSAPIWKRFYMERQRVLDEVIRQRREVCAGYRKQLQLIGKHINNSAKL
jgi:hypothetical protein